MSTNKLYRSMEKHEFLTVANMKVCIDVFCKYMKDKYDYEVTNLVSVKKFMYDVMKEVQAQHSGNPEVSLRDMNNVVLNVMRDHYKTNLKLVRSTAKPNVRSLDRDHHAYGDRSVVSEQLKPHATTRRSPENDFLRLEEARKKETAKAVPKFDEPSVEDALPPDDFNKRIAELTQMRGDLTATQNTRLEQDTQIAQRNIVDVDPKKMYDATALPGNMASAGAALSPDPPVLRQEFVLNPSADVRSEERFFCINGFDRDWSKYRKRFQFAADFTRRHRNVRSITMKRIIVPQEIWDVSSITNVAKTFYNHTFGFLFPYVIVQVDEFDNVFDGSSDNVRKGFSQLVVDKCYRAPNGRGYLVLQSLQDEKKVFQPACLSELSRMTLSVRRPNGELFNESKDDFKIFKLEYELVNKQYLKIVTSKYFDKNEFVKGDNVIIRGFALTKLNPSMTDSAIGSFNAYVNRPQGHEILELGQANDHGYYRTFYIRAPGAFDESAGQFDVDTTLTDTLDMYNDSIDYNVWTYTNGEVLNTALQCIFLFKAEVEVPDAKPTPGTGKLPV